jgi:exonuclease VII small subunit
MNKEVIPFLTQLVKALEESELKLEEAYQEGNSEKISQCKKFILEIQTKISETLK